MSYALANAARLLAEPARAAIVLKLMGGRAVPAGDLALVAHVSPQTTSEHLGHLVKAGFIAVRQIGRHRYYELANEEIAYAVESLLLVASPPSSPKGELDRPALGSLEHARTCYSHLAGWVGVAITDSLRRESYLVPSAERTFAVTDRGKAWFERMGIVIPNSSKTANPRFARQCLDWTERRPHLAGPLGVEMYKRFVDIGWIESLRNSRAVRITLKGRQALQNICRLRWAR